MPGQFRADQPFQLALRSVRGHPISPRLLNLDFPELSRLYPLQGGADQPFFCGCVDGMFRNIAAEWCGRLVVKQDSQC